MEIYLLEHLAYKEYEMVEVTEQLIDIVNNLGYEVKDDLLIEMKNGVAMPVLLNGTRFKIFRRGDENKGLDVNFFNPITETALRGDSPSMQLLNAVLDVRLSKNSLLVLFQFIQLANKGDLPMKVQKLFNDKITARHVRVFKGLTEYATSQGTMSYVFKNKKNIEYKKVRYVMGTSVINNINNLIKGLDPETKFKLEMVDEDVKFFTNLFNKMLKQGLFATSNDINFPSYDSISRAYNGFVKRNNTMADILAKFKPRVGKDLLLTPLPEVDKFQKYELDLRRIPLFKDDMTTDTTIQSATITNETSDEADEEFSLDLDIKPNLSTKKIPEVKLDTKVGLTQQSGVLPTVGQKTSQQQINTPQLNNQEVGPDGYILVKSPEMDLMANNNNMLQTPTIEKTSFLKLVHGGNVEPQQLQMGSGLNSQQNMQQAPIGLGGGLQQQVGLQQQGGFGLNSQQNMQQAPIGLGGGLQQQAGVGTTSFLKMVHGG